MSNGVDPKIAAILPLLPWKDPASLTPKRARDELVALADSRKDIPLPQPASVQDILVDGAAGSIPARMYRASSTASASVVFFHGGGWVAGDLYTHDRTAQALALALDAAVSINEWRGAPCPVFRIREKPRKPWWPSTRRRIIVPIRGCRARTEDRASLHRVTRLSTRDRRCTTAPLGVETGPSP